MVSTSFPPLSPSLHGWKYKNSLVEVLHEFVNALQKLYSKQNTSCSFSLHTSSSISHLRPRNNDPSQNVGLLADSTLCQWPHVNGHWAGPSRCHSRRTPSSQAHAQEDWLIPINHTAPLPSGCQLGVVFVEYWQEIGRRQESIEYWVPLCEVTMDCLHPGHRPSPIMPPFPHSAFWILITIPSCCPSGLVVVKALSPWGYWPQGTSQSLLHFLSLTHTRSHSVNSPCFKLIITSG